MKRRLIPLALVLVIGGVFCSSCEKEEPLSSKKEVLSFIFEASKNATLDQNVIGVVSDNILVANVPFGTDVSALVPTFEVSPKAQISPAEGTALDFSSPVTFTVTAEDGSTKDFVTDIAIEPAPYLGSWRSNAIDFGLGLMYVHVEANENGDITMELEELISGDLDAQSFKGSFNPITLAHEQVLVSQTHQWLDKKWTETNAERTIMYHFEKAPMMRFYYCYCYPIDSWAFEVDLHKQ